MGMVLSKGLSDSKYQSKKPKRDLLWIDDKDLILSIQNWSKKKVKVNSLNNNYQLVILIMY